MSIKHLAGGTSAFALAVAALVGGIGAANATEGYFQTGYGTIQKAQSGAGIANPEDAMTLSVNPAGLVSVGRQFEAAFTLFSPKRDYTAGGSRAFGMPGAMPLMPGKVDSTQDLFLMPNMAYSAPIDAQSAWGVALFGNGGMNTNYQSNVFYGGQTGVNLEQMFLTVGYARKFGDVSVGVSPVVAMQKFRATGVGAFSVMSADAANLTNNGDDYAWGAGLRVGAQWNISPAFRVGLTAQTPIWSTKFDKYAGLYADGGSFDIPGSVGAGVAFDVTPAITLMADYRHIFYGGVKSIANSSTNFYNLMMLGDMNSRFGSGNGSGFGWKDVDVIALAASWKATKDLTLRVGYSHNTNPISSNDVMMNILAPAVVTDHVSGGLTYAWSKNLEIDLAAAYVPRASVSGTNPLAPDQTIKLSMEQYEASIGMRYKY